MKFFWPTWKRLTLLPFLPSIEKDQRRKLQVEQLGGGSEGKRNQAVKDKEIIII